MGSSNSTPSNNISKVVTITSDSIKPAAIEFSKQQLDFNLKDSACPLNTAVYDTVVLSNNTSRKIKFKFDPVHPTTCKLGFSPASGTVDPKKGKKNYCKTHLTC